MRRQGDGEPVLGWTVEQANCQGSVSTADLDGLKGFGDDRLRKVEPDLAFVLEVVCLTDGQLSGRGEGKAGRFGPGLEEIQFGIDSIFAGRATVFPGKMEAELVGGVLAECFGRGEDHLVVLDGEVPFDGAVVSGRGKDHGVLGDRSGVRVSRKSDANLGVRRHSRGSRGGLDRLHNDRGVCDGIAGHEACDRPCCQ